MKRVFQALLADLTDNNTDIQISGAYPPTVYIYTYEIKMICTSENIPTIWNAPILTSCVCERFIEEVINVFSSLIVYACMPVTLQQ